jgi:transcriptional regulator with XRE-family HTH domain/uncharacterized protein YqgV (UPF0045/DUF77 family)
MNDYYFDSLPVHPQPQYLESLTSYLTRLAQANGLASMRQLFKLCFPGEPAKLSFQTGDFPPVSWGALPTLTQCSPERLLATTLYHIGRKFNRVLQARPLAHFLSGSIAYRFLRYCPQCLAEQGYYLLIWRFLVVEGCPDHGCRLLDTCGHCSQQLPLLEVLPKLGFCSRCGGDLRLCQAEPLSQNKLHRSQSGFQDFAYLITSQSCEMSETCITRTIGKQFANWRQIRQLKLVDVAQCLNQSPSIIRSIEDGGENRRVKFQWYVQYADLLQISLRDVFENTLTSPPVQTDEEKLINKIQQAIAILEQQDQPVTQQTVAHMIGANTNIFRHYPQIRTKWGQYKTQRRRQREAELATSVEQAIDSLRQQGKKVSRSAVSKMVGLSIDALKLFHPTAWTIVEEQSDYSSRASPPSPHKKGQPQQMRPLYKREDELLHKVDQAIQRLHQQGQSFSQRAIATLIGMSLPALLYYPRVKAVLRANQVEQGQNEDELLEKVKLALDKLETMGDRLSTQAVSRMVGVSPGTLSYYPRVRALITEQITQKHQKHQTRQRQQREAELIKNVTQAVETLTANGAKITQLAICDIVKVSPAQLKRYPQVKLLLDQVTGLSKPTSLLALQQPEDM